MSDFAKTLVTWAFIVALAFVVFVQAGRLGKKNGGAQTADVINSLGGALGHVVQSSEGQVTS